MNRSCCILIAVGIFFFNAQACAQADAEGAVRLVLTVHNAKLFAGQPLIFRMKLVNEGTKPVETLSPEEFRDFVEVYVSVYDEAGEVVSWSATGGADYDAHYSRGHLLAPGESIETDRLANLNPDPDGSAGRLAYSLGPGSYEVDVWCTNPSKQSVMRSNRVPIRIAEIPPETDQEVADLVNEMYMNGWRFGSALGARVNPSAQKLVEKYPNSYHARDVQCELALRSIDGCRHSIDSKAMNVADCSTAILRAEDFIGRWPEHPFADRMLYEVALLTSMNWETGQADYRGRASALAEFVRLYPDSELRSEAAEEIEAASAEFVRNDWAMVVVTALCVIGILAWASRAVVTTRAMLD